MFKIHYCNWAVFFAVILSMQSNDLFCNANSGANKQMQNDTTWNQLPVILNRIKAPSFPDKDFNILDYGAPTDGIKLSTQSINSAIDACSAAGGGRVIIPAGTFVTGAIRLKSNVNLYISKGAKLNFSTAPSDYLPVVLTRFEGTECYNYSPFIYAIGEQNIAVTGAGTLNGQASKLNWWAWKKEGAVDAKSLIAMGQAGTPVKERIFGEGHKLRPNFIQFYNCKNILIDSVSLINSPMWELHPVLSRNITISNVNIDSKGPNNDGCDPESCKDVLISNCTFATGDDCMAIKSGKNNDGRRVNVPSENIVIQGCTLADGHGGVTIGSEISGGVHNVFAENCKMNSPNLQHAIRIKSNSLRGGTIENIFVRNITVGQVKTDILQVDMYYQEADAGNFTPIVRNIELQNISSENSPMVFNLNCYQRAPVSNIKIINCKFNKVKNNKLNNVSKLQIINTLINGSVPLVPSPVEGYTEAEAYSEKLAWGWSDVLQGFSGTGYMEVVNGSNFIEWNVQKSQNETDTLIIRYANINQHNSPCELYINGNKSTQFAFEPTLSTWKTEKQIVSFKPGRNTIRLVSTAGQTGAFIDRYNLVISPKSSEKKPK